ncbi:ABC transporter permease [Ursidibacter arcticus]
MKNRLLNVSLNRNLKFILPLSILLGWYCSTTIGGLPETALPKISSVGTTAVEMIRSGELYADLGISLRRVLVGFFLASTIGITLGILMGISKKISEFFQLTLTAMRQIPMVAWIPLIILWAGIDELSKIVVILFAATFPIIVNTINGIDSTSKSFLEVAEVYRMSKWDTFRKIYLPSALPALFTGLRLSLGISWMAVVASELIASSSGIGFRLNDARSLMRSDVVIVCMFVIGSVGLLMDKIICIAAELATPWKNN